MDQNDRHDVGIQCLYCNQWQVPPNRKLESWTCNYCFSGFLSIPMLTNLLPRELVRDLLHHEPSPKPSHGCAVCRVPMTHIAIVEAGDGQEVSVEICRRCRLAWFQSGEIVKFLQRPGIREAIQARVEIPNVERGVKRRPVKPEVVVAEKKPIFPLLTVTFFIICTLNIPLAIYDPNFFTTFGFFPSQPFRGLGLSFYTSYLVNTRSQIHGPILFLMLGIYAEREMGRTQFGIFLVAAATLGRMPYLIWGADSEPFVAGLTPVAIALAGFGAGMFPYGDYLFPKEKYKSPHDGLGWLATGGLLYFVVFVLIDLVNQSFAGLVSAASELRTPAMSELHLSSDRWSAIFCLALGVFWAIVLPEIKLPEKKEPA